MAKRKKQNSSQQPTGKATLTSSVITTQDQYVPWNRGKITAALEREANIPLEVANLVAESVEAKIKKLQITHITTSQIRELVDSELFSMGHPIYRQRQSIMGISKFNLKNWLYPQYQQGTSENIGDLVNHVASVIFRQYSMEEVFAPEIAEAHLSGAIHIKGLSWPMKFFSLLFDIKESGLFEKSMCPEELLAYLIAAIEKIHPYVYGPLNLCGIDTCLQNLPTCSQKGKNKAVSYIRSLLVGLTHNYNKLPAYCFVCHNTPGDFSKQLYSAYSDIDRKNKRGFLPTIVQPISSESFETTSKSALLDICRLSVQMRKVTFSLRQPYLAAWPNPKKITWVLDTIAINLVQASCKAGEKQLGKFWDKLSEIFSIVVKAHLDKKRFFGSLAEGPLKNFFQNFGGRQSPLTTAGCFLEIVGLPESVLYLTGKEMNEEEGWEVAIQTLARLKELADDAIEKHGIHLYLVNYMKTGEAEQRFVKLDSERFPFLENFFPEATYTKGPHFRTTASLSSKEQIEREGILHRYIPSTIILMPELDPQELFELLQFAHIKTQAVGLCIA